MRKYTAEDFENAVGAIELRHKLIATRSGDESAPWVWPGKITDDLVHQTDEGMVACGVWVPYTLTELLGNTLDSIVREEEEAVNRLIDSIDDMLLYGKDVEEISQELVRRGWRQNG